MRRQTSPSSERNLLTFRRIKEGTDQTVSERLSCKRFCGFEQHLQHPVMSFVLGRMDSYSSSSTVRANLGLNRVASSSQSIYGDFNFSSSSSPSYELPVFGNEKLAMQNLNSRLASYLEKVLSLETANQKLEQKIKVFYESRSPSTTKDLSKYYGIIEDLQKQILAKTKDKYEVFMKIENCNITASDFKMKFENERNMNLAVEADLTRLRTVLGEMGVTTKDLQIQLSDLKEEMSYLKKSHEEELCMIRTQQSGSVNVEVDCAPAVNLNKELEEMREQYEALVLKNREQAERWFQDKVKTLNTEVIQSRTEITGSQTVLSELKKKYQCLEIEIKGIQTQIQNLQWDLGQVGARYSQQLSQLQLYIDQLQKELQQINVNIQQQSTEYQILLDIKMRLELEIAEYRRLLEGEGNGYSITEVDSHSTTTTVSTTVTEKTIVEEKTQEEEEHHFRQKRVKIITEELVDGVVVSSSMDEKVQLLST